MQGLVVRCPGHNLGDGTERVGRDLSFEPVDISKEPTATGPTHVPNVGG